MYGILNDDGSVIAEFVTPLTFLSNQGTVVGDALSLKRTVALAPAQRWELECRLSPKNWDADELFVHFTVKGQHSKYNLIVPQNLGVVAKRTSASSFHQVTGEAGDRSVALTNWTGYAAAGTFIRFSNHSKIYMLTAPLTFNSTHVQIYPELHKRVVNGSFKHRDDVVMEAWLDTGNIRGMSMTDGVLMDLGVLKFVEAL